MNLRSEGLFLLAMLAPAAQAVAQATPAVIISRAIVAAGGEKSLAAARGFEWEGRATVHVPGRTIALTGKWQVIPPDSAIVTTWETTRGPATARAIIISGKNGWVRRDSTLTPMAADMAFEERHQFYLYSLMRLLPLRDTAIRLRAIGLDAEGNFGLRAEQTGRLPVSLYFSKAGRLVRLVTTFASAKGGEGDLQEIRLSGTMDAGGVHWFKRMDIERRGEAYFDLEIAEIRAVK